MSEQIQHIPPVERYDQAVTILQTAEFSGNTGLTNYLATFRQGVEAIVEISSPDTDSVLNKVEVNKMLLDLYLSALTGLEVYIKNEWPVDGIVQGLMNGIVTQTDRLVNDDQIAPEI